MGNLNDYFSREEFACRCGCGFDSVNPELLEALTDVRIRFNAPLTITSGNRCKSHNASVGGAADSQHIQGWAADFKVKGVHPVRIHAFLEEKYPDKHGLGYYPNRIHFDVRPEKARWRKNV